MTFTSPLFAVTLLDGISWGVILVLLAIGLTIIFGFMEVINFPHGVLYAGGGYALLVATTSFDSFWLGFLLAPLAVGLLALLIELLLLRPTYDHGPITQVFVLLGATLLIEGAIFFHFGSLTKSVSRPSMFYGSVSLLGFEYPSYRLFIMVVGAVLIAATWAFIKYSEIGLVLRASLTDKEMARVLGHDIPTIYTLVYVGSCMLTAVAGALMTPLQGVGPQTPMSVLILAFIVVIIGGIGSFKGTVIAGLGVGILDILLTSYISFRVSGILIFVFLLVVLVVRPRGLFGEEGVMT